jgi:hypothetical protein
MQDLDGREVQWWAEKKRGTERRDDEQREKERQLHPGSRDDMCIRSSC